MSQSAGTKYKKGEHLFKEGEQTDKLFIIERGKVSLFVERSGKRIEVVTMGKGQVLGEQSLFSKARQSFTAEAASETIVMEVPIAIIQKQFEGSQPGVKLVLKSMVEEAKQSRQAMRSIKMSQDASPCPQVSVPRVFCILNLVAQYLGEQVVPEEPTEVASADGTGSEEEEIMQINEALMNQPEFKIDFGTLQLYTSRMFAESPQRMRSLLDLLVKLEVAELEFETNEDGEEELDQVLIKDLQIIEDFAEFYQYHLYKPGKSEMIYPEALPLKVASAFLALSEGLESDHRGCVNLDFGETAAKMKSDHQMELSGTHLDSLERKGLFVQRVPEEDKTWLRFEREEFKQTLRYWKIIEEIEQWNEKGFVDMAVAQEEEASAANGCPACGGEIEEVHKFCPHCGQGLQSAA